jgi:hypothetical protein
MNPWTNGWRVPRWLGQLFPTNTLPLLRCEWQLTSPDRLSLLKQRIGPRSPDTRQLVRASSKTTGQIAGLIVFHL